MSPYATKSFLGAILNAKVGTNGAVSGSASSDSAISSKNDTTAASLPVVLQSAGYSSGNFCRIEVGGQSVVGNGVRGLNVVLLDHRTGTVLEVTDFDTHISKEESEDFSRLIETAVDGSFVLVAAKDDCREQLTEAAKLACESIGSKMIREVAYRDGW